MHLSILTPSISPPILDYWRLPLLRRIGVRINGVMNNDIPSGTVGDVLPGSLLGPILGLAFSTDGDLLFAGSGSSISIYDVRSGALLSTARVFTPGVAVCGMDIGQESCEFVGWGQS